MDRKAVSMWKVTKNLILTDVCVIALFWLIPSAKMLVLSLGVLCAVGYMLWLGRCFLNDCKANLPNEDYQRIAAEFGPVGENSGSTPPRKAARPVRRCCASGAGIWCLSSCRWRSWRCWFGWGKRSYKIMHSYIAGCDDLGAPCKPSAHGIP